MKNFDELKVLINKLKFQSQQLSSVISSIKENDVSVRFYLGNLKRSSLQALDLFNVMEKQVIFMTNQKDASIRREKIKERRTKER